MGSNHFPLEISLPLIVEYDSVIIRTLATLISHLTGRIYLKIVLAKIQLNIFNEYKVMTQGVMVV